jgi:hypothetical protein
MLAYPSSQLWPQTVSGRAETFAVVENSVGFRGVNQPESFYLLAILQFSDVIFLFEASSCGFFVSNQGKDLIQTSQCLLHILSHHRLDVTKWLDRKY